MDYKTDASTKEGLTTDKAAPKKVILSMVVKKETTWQNALSIPCVLIVTTAAGAYYNTQ